MAGIVSAPQRSRGQLGARQALIPIGYRGRGVNGSAAYFDATSTTVMDQTAWWTPPVGQVTAIQLVYAGFDMPQQGEADRAASASLTAALSFPSAPAITVNANAGFASGATSLTFQATLLGANGISVGSSVGSSGGGVATGAYVTAVSSSYVAGPGNNPGVTTVSLSAGLTAATAPGQPFTFTGAIVPAYFAGQRTLALTPRHGDYRSDLIACAPPPNSTFFVRSFASFAAAGMQLMDYPGVQTGTATRLAGEFCARSTAQTDQTLNPSIISNTGGGYFCPVAILALVSYPAGTPVPGAALIIGDSIAAGTGDNSDGTLGIMGYVQRSLGNARPWISLARGSTTAFATSVQGRGQYALSVESGITDVFVEGCRNDLQIGRLPASLVQNAVATIAAPFIAAGKRVWAFTCPPSTYSNDAWGSAANQGFPVATASTTATATASASTTLALASVANLAAGQLVCPASGTGTISAGTTISSVGSTGIVLSLPLAAALPASTTLFFATGGGGTASASTTEVQRLAYNAAQRGSFAAQGYAGLVDIDGICADSTGRWIVAASGNANTLDGVHPPPWLHQAAVTAGIVPVTSIVA